jgi:hypothetical protein
VRKILDEQLIQINSIEWITPTLEDVFISSVSSTNPK